VGYSQASFKLLLEIGWEGLTTARRKLIKREAGYYLAYLSAL